MQQDRTGQPADMEALRALSARIGADPLLTQGAGGNTSVKEDGILRIKASGTWLAHALDRDIFVPVHMQPLIHAVQAAAPEAEEAQRFTIQAQNPLGLRPSIETTVHALMPHRIVLHVHCVDTIAWAVRTNGRDAIAERLEGLNWAWIPYARPGLPLAMAIEAHSAGNPDVLVLGNHGLAVAADSVEAADALLSIVKQRVLLPARPVAVDAEALARLAADNPGYKLPASTETHAVALDPIACAYAGGGSLYPDHVIFLGEGVAVAAAGETAAAVGERLGSQPPMILFPGKGVLLRGDANDGAEVMARCLADVCRRIPEGAPVRYLNREEHLQLTDWDAEKYRQSLNRAKSA